ncbi:Lanosterol synthase erg7A [Exophiala xenobiotica]|nr:Lanosterol synthase erg7A [Exophiala xenobiotica]KAK5552844.1 Lanosterol synthase erg7A [Exophiala xenobiotica]
MAQTRQSAQKAANGASINQANGHSKGSAKGHANGHIADPHNAKTDRSRWRLHDVSGRHTWHYLKSDQEIQEWPQTTADKYHLGLPTNLPDLPPASKPSESIDNCLTFYSKLQLPPGNWACEYGGPLFLLPGFVICWYATGTPIPTEYEIEIRNYLFARQNKDGGWGLHVEGHSSVFGTAMNYTILRILGSSEEDPRMIKARGKLHQLGGAINGPHWAKFWLSVLGVTEWSIVNPVPPELWLLPDWVPIHPWRWWIHMRQVMLPMSYIWSKKFTMPENALIRSLRQELFVQPYETIDFGAHRNSIAPEDNYHPKTWLLNFIMSILVWIWIPFLRTRSIIEKAEAWAWRLVQYEDHNTDYADLAPVNAPMNTLVCYIHEGPKSYSFQRHLYRLEDYLWVNKEGMLANGTNGVQVWDTAFTIQACVEAGLADSPKWKPMLTQALSYLESEQIREEVPDRDICYRQSRKGAWPFSTKLQGYTVSDCTSEALRVVLLLQNAHNYSPLLDDRRIKDAVDVLLTMQNKHTGGFASYEPQRGSEYLEMLNAAEVFGRIMVEYDYPECTTAVVTVLSLFQKFYPEYRTDEIRRIKETACQYIRRAQRDDGSWYGSWGICFTYGAMFALESLSSVGESYSNSSRVKRACDFLIGHQMPDGGWGESYRASELKVWVDHPEKSQVVQTCWAVIALMYAGFPDKEPLRRALQMVMGRQQANGEWLQESIEGVFNCSCMITYPNYKFYFPVKALGMYKARWGDEVLL